MSGHRAKANINGINWEGAKNSLQHKPWHEGIYLPISLDVEIEATDLAGLDPTRTIIITQEPTPDSEPAAWAAPGGDLR